MANINASIEVSPKQAAESSAIEDLFPPGGRVISPMLALTLRIILFRQQSAYVILAMSLFHISRRVE